MKKIYTIGRDEGCDIVIPDSTDVISRLHATIRVESNDKIFLIDQSRNGTYVNGMKMTSNVEIPVSRKDVVSFAHIYNLDWSLVPKNKGNILKIILVSLLSILLIVGIAYVCIEYFSEPEISKPVKTVDERPDPPLEEPVKADSTVVQDTSEAPKKAKPKTNSSKKNEKDTVSVQKPEEEVYNPIY